MVVAPAKRVPLRPDLFPSIGFTTDVRGLPNLLERIHGGKLNGMELAELEAMEAKVRELRLAGRS
ncbi:unnamed protein product [Effrenium voratum]|uniref:Uncharacterized protein n=1 Tax=Effrenium voratum TaxID=2562239 RepID=A0AA36HNZ7_9DINO|nr:unnamed protein product [Effrenium voratum]